MQQKNRRKYVYSILVGMLSAVLLAGNAVQTEKERCVKEEKLLTAWWGTLYPEFCFSEEASHREIRFALWVALSSLW